MRRGKLSALTASCLAGLLAACGGDELQAAKPATSSPAFAVSPVAAYGRLKVCGTHICSAGGQAVQLRGMSFFWSNTGWGGERFMNASAVSSLASGWNATVIRAPLGVEGKGGYLESSTAAAANVARVKALVDGAIAAGVYVIVDWHYSSNAVYQAQAQAFFQQMAQQYASVPNIIWEPFNEPTSNSWASLKSYHQAIISTIRAAGSQNLVVVGTPTWSQDVDVAANDPITTDSNVAYTLHFYAGTHTQWLRDKANTAMGRGRAIFVTEYGTCDASGNGNFNPTESKNWTNWMDQNQISSANWSLNDKAETASALVAGASASGPWPDAQLTQSGAWVKPYIVAGYSNNPTSYSLTISRSGNGSGTVTSSPAGVSCGSTCSASFAAGTSVTLTAVPASGSTFAGWSGACSGTGACTVSMTQAQSVTASFTGPAGSYTLNVAKDGTGSGTVTSSPAGVSCGSVCSATFTSGTSVTLSAVASSGSTFTGWSGAACSGTGTCTVTMSQAQSVTASFAGGSVTGPCANPITLTSGNSGSFNTVGAVCYRTAATVNGWGCYNTDGRTVSVNGTATTCGKTPVAKWTDGYTYFGFTAGAYSWAGFYYY